jgi:solute carrier family 25 protein 33/36
VRKVESGIIKISATIEPLSNQLSFLARFLVARTRLREQAREGVFKYTGMWQSLAVIAREEGRQGLYSGMGVHLMKTVPNSAFMFLTYEIVRKWLGEFTIVDQ